MSYIKLKEYEGQFRKVQIERVEPFGDYINGFVQSVGKEVVVIQQFHDFYCEGYGVIRNKDISNIRSGEYERFFEKMIKGEGIIDCLKAPLIPKVDTIRDLLVFFMEKKEYVIVECERDRDEESTFSCGLISEIEGDTIWIKEFDALGNWCEEELGVELSEITQMQFQTPYLSIFSKYIPSISDQE